MNYKLSQYNVLHESNHDLTIYNLISGGMLHLTGAYFEKMSQYLKKNNINLLPDDLIAQLISGKMLIDIDFDEFEYLKLLDTYSRFSPTNLNLTIAPTTKCNFSCTYCYEKGNIEYCDMNKNTQRKLIEWIRKQMNQYKRLSIAWYGGEPLLNIDCIENISKELINEGIDFSASIVTNGYNLTLKNALLLKKNQVKKIQITLDGPEEIHDQRRFTYTGGKTFKKILENIQTCCEVIPISIRVNIDKDNVQYIDKLIETLDTYQLNNKVHLYIAPVENITGTNCNSSCCFSNRDFANIALDFYYHNINRGYFNHTIYSFKPVNCGAVCFSSYVVDSLGNLYKCWDDIGILDEKIGSIFEPLQINKNALKWLSYDCFSDEECRTCKMLPVCMGGCPNKPIKKQPRSCTSLKYIIDDYLSLFKNAKLK